MSGKDFLKNMENIDEELIEEASKPCDMSKTLNNKKKKIMNIIAPVLSAAALFFVCFGVYEYNKPQEEIKFNSVNSIDKNEIEANGIEANGIEANEIEANGIEDNGIEVNGIEANGIEVNGIEVNGIEAENDVAEDTGSLNWTPVDPSQIHLPFQPVDGKEVTPGNAQEVVEESVNLIRVNGVVYYDSGKISNEGRCGLMDGYIDSQCSGIPQKDNQANFGTGYGYQFWQQSIEVLIEDQWHIFYPYEADSVFEPQGNSN